MDNQQQPENRAEKKGFNQVRQMLLISFGSAFITLLLYVLIFEPLKDIQNNKLRLLNQQAQIESIRESIQVSRQELEAQMQLYIEENYGDVSERDENIAKLMIYFKQQDARLSNIEEALAKF
jgi:hypothetical protein